MTKELFSPLKSVVSIALLGNKKKIKVKTKQLLNTSFKIFTFKHKIIILLYFNKKIKNKKNEDQSRKK
jgi:hypothetical protein